MNEPTQLLTVRGLTGGYGGPSVFQDLDFDIAEGEIVAVLGSNGAGKSTLLRALSGALPVREGQLSFRGKPIARTTSRITAQGIAHVPEGRRVFSGMTVVENLLIGQTGAGKRTALVLDDVWHYFPRLFERRASLGGMLSGGEQQMLALARGLMSKPALLMIDEPSLGLSPIMADTVFEIVDRLNRETGLAVLLVEQRIESALNLASRGFVLDRGAFTLSAPAAQLMSNDEVISKYMGV